MANVSKRKALSVISEVYDLYTAQLFIDALFGDIEEAFLYGKWEEKQFNAYAKQFGVDRIAYIIEDDMYGVKGV